MLLARYKDELCGEAPAIVSAFQLVGDENFWARLTFYEISIMPFVDMPLLLQEGSATLSDAVYLRGPAHQIFESLGLSNATDVREAH